MCILPVAILRGDNAAANSIGSALASVRKVRHLSLATLWIREASERNQVKLIYVRSSENTADLLTKILGVQALDPLLWLLNIFSLLQ